MSRLSGKRMSRAKVERLMIGALPKTTQLKLQRLCQESGVEPLQAVHELVCWAWEQAVKAAKEQKIESENSANTERGEGDQAPAVDESTANQEATA